MNCSVTPSSRPWWLPVALLVAILLGACGGGGDGPTAAPTLPATVAPTLTAQPASQHVDAPDPAGFSVTADGTAPSYQWQRSTDGGATWSDIPGATAPAYDTGATSAAMNDLRLRVVVSNAAGSVTSSAAVLTVRPAAVGTFQFNLFGFNAGPSAFLLYGGNVKDAAGTLQCSGYAALADPCPRWRGDYPNGTSLTLTATPWPKWRVSGWVGGDCGTPGSATSVTLTIDHNSNCFPQFELIPGSSFSVSAVPAGAWIGVVVEMVADRFGNLVVAEPPRIHCGPLAGAQACDTPVEVGASDYTLIRLRALRIPTLPVGQVRWTCTSLDPEDHSPVERTAIGDDIALGPIFGDTACSAELIPTL